MVNTHYDLGTSLFVANVLMYSVHSVTASVIIMKRQSEDDLISNSNKKISSERSERRKELNNVKINHTHVNQRSTIPALPRNKKSDSVSNALLRIG